MKIFASKLGYTKLGYNKSPLIMIVSSYFFHSQIHVYVLHYPIWLQQILVIAEFDWSKACLFLSEFSCINVKIRKIF